MADTPYRRKIFFFFLTVFLIISFTAFGLFYRERAVLEEKRDLALTEREVSLLQNNINTALLPLFHYFNRIKESHQVWLWHGSEKNEYYYYMKKVQDKLKKESSFYSQLVYSVGISFKGSEFSVVTARGSENKQAYFSVYGLTYEDVEHLEDQTGSLSGKSPVRVSISEKGERFIHFSVGSRFKERDMIFYLTISAESVIQGKEEFIGNWVLINDREILGGYSEKLFNNLFITPVVNNLFHHQKKNILSVEAEEMTVYTAPLSVLNWKLVYFSEREQNSLTDLISMLLIPAACILIISIFLAWYLSGVLYSPLKSVMNQINEHSGPSGDEFQLILHETRNLKELNEEMQALLQYKEEQLKKQWLREFCLGHSVTEELPLRDYCCDGSLHTPLLVQVKSHSRHKLVTLGEYFETALAKTGDIPPVILNSETLCFIIRNRDQETLKEAVERVISEKNLETECLISLGSGVKEFSELPSSCLMALENLENSYLLKESGIIIPDQFKEKRSDYSYSFSEENRIITLTLEGKSEVLNVIKELLYVNFSKKCLMKEQRKHLVISLKGTITRILSELQLTSEEAFAEEGVLYSSLEESCNRDDIDTRVLKLFSSLINKVERESQVIRHDLKETMTAYIKNNYHDDIMLVDLAEELQISLKQCSALFKKLTGQNFKDYLNTLRVKKAREILKRESHVKIHELAGRVGFNSSNTFIRVFKKYEGISPGSFARV